MEQKRLNTLIFIGLPFLLGSVLYLIYVKSTGFAEPETYSVAFHMQTVVNFYIYLWACYQTDKWSQGEKLKLSGFQQKIFIFFTGFLIAWPLSLSVYSAVKQFHISFMGQNDSLNAYKLWLHSLTSFASFLMVYSIYISFTAYLKSTRRSLKEEQLQREQLEIKYQLLTQQLDPHFLFNNLNTLHSLISSKSDQAEDFVLQLSRVMRYSLQSNEEALVDLEVELGILKDYCTILQSRFGQALQVTYPGEQAPDARLIPMTLMHLMENVIKHNQIDEKHPMMVKLSIEANIFTISNSVHKKLDVDRNGKGLSHLKDIYHIKYNKPVRESQQGDTFQVQIPLIKS